MSAAAGRFAHVRFISAGAGSGKTYRLTEVLEEALVRDRLDPATVIGTTFTVKAAGELRERVRARLVSQGRPQLAEQMGQALIGTVHAVCERLLRRFSFELGLSPRLEVVSIEDGARLFDQALDEELDPARVRALNDLAARLGLADERGGAQWGGHVRDVAEAARGNDIDPGALPGMGRDSADSLLVHFPAAARGDASAALRGAVERALAAIDLETDTTKGTREYAAFLRGAAARLRRGDWTWGDWISLSKRAPAKRSAAAAAPVQEAAARYESSPGFRRDIREYVESVFAVAARTLSRFQAIKTRQGYIDFTDMEQLALHALDVPEVRERLGDDLALLLVDEFQDTNPMQLALFMKLAALARRVVFVGDVKQAIYAFRGCDPDLVFETLEGIAAHGGGTAVLPDSWRSSAPLVEYANAVFAEAFALDGMAPERVRLAPRRGDGPPGPAVASWTLTDRNAGARARALARAIADLVDAGTAITDPDDGAERPLRWGDVAVLAATNAHVDGIATALRALRVPMKMTLAGLLETPEVCLARACLRRLNDAGDTLATAEILSLAGCAEPEEWLADRLRWLRDGHEPLAWGTASTHVARLEAQRDEVATRSPVEIVARVLEAAGVREAVTAWGPDAIKAAQRGRNLDAFLDLAVAYERHCESQHEAATLTGFLFWVEHPRSPELDLQPVVTTGDAVHVLTYHRAKGLEWPLVIATDFDRDRRSRLWDVRVTGGRGGVDDPLADRAVRFWPAVFGANTKGVPVLERIAASADARECDARDASEQRRLAYVGMTRARDRLVIALPGREPGERSWLHALGCDFAVPGGETLALPGGGSLATAAVSMADRGDAPRARHFTPAWFPERAPLEAPVREAFSPSGAGPAAGARIGEVIEIGDRMAVRGDDMASIGSALHAVIAAEIVNPGLPGALERARAILDAWRVGAQVDAADALACARRFRASVDARFAPRRVLCEQPVTQRFADGRVASGWVDVLVETAAGWVVVDHKSSPRPRAEWAAEALAHSGQLAAYGAALEAAGRVVAGRWIHFPVTGGLVEVRC